MKVVATLVTTLALAAPAQAHVPGQSLAQRVAAQTFTPLCGPVTIEAQPLVNGVLALAEADTTTCTVRFGPSVARANPETVCVEMTHEYGHLSGLGHSTDPNNIMYPDEQNRLYQPCRDAANAAFTSVDHVAYLRHEMYAQRRRGGVRFSRATSRYAAARAALDPADVQFVNDTELWSRQRD